MQHTYYVDLGGVKDGPHTLVSIMRRIRTGKIQPDTLIYTGQDTTPRPANTIQDIAHFFRREPDPSEEQPQHVSGEHVPLSIRKLIHDSWQFTIEHNSMTVYAGGLMLTNIMIAAGLVNMLGTITGGLLAWAFCILCHNLYMIFMLRLYRHQPISSDFINRQMAPALSTIITSCVILAFMMGGGLLLLVVPCLLVSVYYIFVPFLIIDHQYGTVEAMHASRLLLQKHNQQYTRLVAILILMHYICLLLVIPIPLTLPMFTSALADLYEKISNS